MLINVGDWGLGIGDCPIPNPQSQNHINSLKNLLISLLLINLTDIKLNKITTT